MKKILYVYGVLILWVFVLSLLLITKKGFIADHSFQSQSSITYNENIINDSRRGRISYKNIDLEFSFIFEPTEICKWNPHWIIFIHSAPKNTLQRNAVRTTWGKDCFNSSSHNISCVFVVGTTRDDNNAISELKSETNFFKDVIVVNISDTYANLTYKTMAGLRWTDLNCQSARFVMKTDDDMFVNTELLQASASKYNSSHFIGGRCWGPAKPIRNKQSKWFVSIEQYNRTHYPVFCSGSGYIISKDLIPKLLNISAKIPFLYLEDVYIGLCVNALGYTPKNLNGFNNGAVKMSKCNYSKSVITAHGFNPIRFWHVWEDIQQCRNGSVKDTRTTP
ncbi:beta-1,3-galactosyltransferase 5-like [Mya arenaria]|uniref:beta-1,3-galactosyltransferase 5-like n=1 Tax=Mya arenaria TaxID=6604 RepID=UPI0022E85A28|nr:beta-1,3-galactosyltransferase 5-like [Mya arenaria]